MHRYVTSSRDDNLARLILFCLQGDVQPVQTLCRELAQEYGVRVTPRHLIKALAQLQGYGWVEKDINVHGLMGYQLTERGWQVLYEQRNSLQKSKEQLGLTELVTVYEEKEMHYLRWTHWILRCYPSAWRERYGQEMLALLEQHAITPLTLLDLGLGALDAHLTGGYHRFSISSIFFKNMRTTTITLLTAVALFVFALPNWFIVAQVFGSKGSLSDLVVGDQLHWINLLLILLALLISNGYTIALLVRENIKASGNKLLRPILLCLMVLLSLPFLPGAPSMLLARAFSLPTSGPIDQMASGFLLSTLLASALFIILQVKEQIVARPIKSLLLASLLVIGPFAAGYIPWQAFLYSPNLMHSWNWDIGGYVAHVLPFFVNVAALMLAVQCRKSMQRALQKTQLPAFMFSVLTAVNLIVALVSYGSGLYRLFSLPVLLPEQGFLWPLWASIDDLGKVLMLAIAAVLTFMAFKHSLRMQRASKSSMPGKIEQELVQLQQ
ncbi:hypothetical protein EPA93_09685 [Ktedonosporobacter rubrisoli]|uniref:Uncharacterized protein n=1 Tax=Ktedonosporobacter rubrisoli TaxID=2509675 RepID=A0A4P6JM17_KTERU|nr:hypothetical protein [Ktedonosporobacter rubrisoli]QBD76265.1 hypothetical protein EPA93_09685 [Ktedonosporobacter rubrisoli]